MNEKEIFQAAVEISDVTQRQAYLASACGGNAALRARVEALLAAHAAASSEFLNVPAMEQTPPTVSGQQQTLELPATGGGTDAAPRHDHEDDETDGPANLSFLQPPTKPGSLGRLGHYEILQVLGQGAFGIVFKAFDEKLHRHVAIKAMSPELASTSPPRKRFLREARSVAALKHENIIQIYSVDEQPLPYLAMELVDGQTLQQKLDGSGPLEVPEILYLGRQMAAGLAAAHGKGLIHRDIKPGNILIEAGAEQKVKITDFGLARAADDATMTRTGTIAGTPMYMAPEQALGQTLDHHADLFSLGSVLYQMTCGRPPFRGANAMAVLKRVIDETPRPIQDILPQVPDWLCTIIEKLHAKNPDERYQTAKEVADLLARCQNELQLTGKVTSVPVRHKPPAVVAPTGASLPTRPSATKQSSRRPIVAVVAAAILLIGGLSVTELTGITHLFRKPSPEAVPVAGGGAQSERNGGVIEPTHTADRRAAEWVLSIGGSVDVHFFNGEGKTVKDLAALPAEPFILRHPYLSMTKVTDEGLAHLRECKRLTQLSMHSTKVSDAGLANFQGCTELIHINLGSNEITDAGLANFKDCKGLRFLALTGNKLTGSGLAHFQDCKKLSSISLIATGVEDSGLAVFKNSTSLRKLVIRGSKITEKFLAEFHATVPQCRIEHDGRVYEPSVAADLDRRAAEWVLGVGGKVYTYKERRPILNSSEIPLVDQVVVALDSIAAVTDEIMALFANSSRITELGISGCAISDAGLAPLAKMKQLRSLSAGGTRVSNEGLTHLKGCELYSLYLHGTPISDGGLAHLLDIPTLLAVDLRSTEITDDGLKILARHPQLNTIGLEGPKITDAGLVHLQTMKKLRTLQLSHTAVTDEGLSRLARLENLTTLHLDGCGITDAGLKHLHSLASLSALTLQKTKITAEGVKQLAAALPKCRIEWDVGVIEPSAPADPDRRTAEWVLSVGGALGIRVEGQERTVIELGQLPSTAFSVYGVTIHGGKVEDADLARFADLRELTGFDLRDVPITDAGLMHLRNLTKLLYVTLQGTKITGDGLKYLEHSQDLVNLNLERTNLGLTGLRYSTLFPRLQGLNLDRSPIADADIDFIVAHPKLRELTFRGSSLVDPNTCLQKIADLNELEFLSFGDAHASEAGFEHLRRLTKLTHLQVMSNGLDDRSLAHLEPLQKLELIDLGGTRITNAGVVLLGKYPELRSVTLLGTSIDDVGLARLAVVKRLNALDIGHTKVTEAGIAQLRSFPELERLSLQGTPTSDTGLAHLAGLTKLRSLLLTETKVTGDGVRKLSTTIPRCRITWDGGVIEPKTGQDEGK